MTERERRGIALVVLSAVLYGMTPTAVVKLSENGIDAFAITAGKSWLSLPLLFVLCRSQGGLVRPNGKQGIILAFAALCMNLLTPLLLYASYSYLSTGMSTTLHFVYPIIVLFGSAIFLRRKIRRIHIVCLALVVTGLILLFFPFDGWGQSSLNGVLLALSSGITYACYIICVDTNALKDFSPIQMTFWITLIASLMLASAIPFFEKVCFPDKAIEWIVFAAVSIVFGVICMLLFQRGVQFAGAPKASIISTFEPATSIVAGCILFSEKLSIYEGIGCLIILASVILLVIKSEKAL